MEAPVLEKQELEVKVVVKTDEKRSRPPIPVIGVWAAVAILEGFQFLRWAITDASPGWVVDIALVAGGFTIVLMLGLYQHEAFKDLAFWLWLTAAIMGLIFMVVGIGGGYDKAAAVGTHLFLLGLGIVCFAVCMGDWILVFQKLMRNGRLRCVAEFKNLVAQMDNYNARQDGPQ